MKKIILYKNRNIIKEVNIESIFNTMLNNKNSDFVYVNLVDPTEEELNDLKTTFFLHTLSIEDCINKVTRAKVDNYDSHYFFVLTNLQHKKENGEYSLSNIYCFASTRFFISISYEKEESIEKLIKKISSNRDFINKGADFLLYEILDDIVDNYYIRIEDIEGKIESLEEKIMTNPNKAIRNKIIRLKKTVFKIKKIINPQREVLNLILRHDFSFITDKNRIYFSDINDHFIRVSELIESYQEMLTSCLELYSSELSNSMNNIMKVLTMITTIIMPITVVTGIYGMNFENMPELHMQYGYYFSISIMVLIVIVNIIYFKKKKWF